MDVFIGSAQMQHSEEIPNFLKKLRNISDYKKTGYQISTNNGFSKVLTPFSMWIFPGECSNAQIGLITAMVETFGLPEWRHVVHGHICTRSLLQ